ncbi:MAG: ROK family protein [Planctomycetales bacterium]|nr:ROK family protein [Planctomycetales bacterium]
MTRDPRRATLSLGVDLGGSRARVGLVDLGTGSVLARAEFPTGRDCEPDPTLARAGAEGRRLLEARGLAPGDLAGAGLGAPGPLSSRTGVIAHTPNLPRWREVPAAELLSEALGRPARLQNDANCAALGEWRFGAGRGAEILVLLTLGTGVGGGIVIGGSLLEGPDGTAGHVGHMAVSPDGPPCPCGSRGCLEATAGAAGIAALYASAGGAAGTSPAEIAVIHGRARAGDSAAAGALRSAGRALGVAVASLANLLNPDAVVLTGGISDAESFLFPEIREALRTRAFPAPAARVRLLRGTLGEDSGRVGAAVWGAEAEGRDTATRRRGDAARVGRPARAVRRVPLR